MLSLDRDAAQQKLAAFQDTLNEDSPAEIAGRGLIVCAGGAQIFLNAYVLLDVLRNVLKSDIAVEVWHLGAEEMTPAMAALLREHGVEVVDARQVLRRFPAEISDGWQLKAYALLRSRFAEVLMLDADQVCVSDPAALFEWPEYRETGAVFWPDIVELPQGAAIWDLVGLPARTVRSFESGQLLVDKRRHWKAVRLALFFNEEAATYYQLIYGDKDTFLLAWLLTGSAFHQIAHPPFVPVYGLLQRDMAGAPLFQHRTQLKWVYTGEQISSPNFIHEAACLDAIERLRRRWAGRVFHPPLRSLAARAAEAALAGSALRLSAIGQPSEHLELNAHGEIGKGRAPERQHWYVIEEDGGLVLILHDGTRETHAVSAAGEGRWAGSRLVPPVGGIVAVAETPPRAAPSQQTLLHDLLRAAGFPDIAAEDLERLEGSVSLLARVDPMVVAALESVVRDGDPSIPGHAELAAMAQRIALLAETPASIERSDISVLHANYLSIYAP